MVPLTPSRLPFAALFLSISSRLSLAFGSVIRRTASGRSLLISIALIAYPAFSHAAANADLRVQSQDRFYLSPAGNDENPGTIDHPLRTIQRARDIIAARTEPMRTDIYVCLRGGVYPMDAPIEFKPSDSGNNGHIIHYVAYRNEVPVISGGKRITGWSRYDNNVYKATLDRDSKLRQLYVNGQRALMARGSDFSYTSEIKGVGTSRINEDEPWAMSSGTRFAGFTFSKANLEQYKNPDDVELISKAGFGHHIVSLSAITDSGNGYAAILQEPIGAIAQSVPQDGGAFISNMPKLKAVSEFHFQNALELLNAPGQFYFDRRQHILYYYKRPNEDMGTAEVIAPLSEGLMVLKGSSVKTRVANIEFRGITFAYSHYSLTKVAQSYGDTAVQSIALYTKYLEDGDEHKVKYTNTTVQRAAIECENSSGINFIDDVFKHIGEVGLSLGNDSNDSKVIGGLFYDIGSSAINVGDPKNVYVGDGDFPPDVEGIPTGDVIENNYLRDLGIESLQAPAVSIFYARDLNLSHNEISTAPYTGISLGWGWTSFTRIKSPHNFSQSAANNKVDYNRIENVMLQMHDGAGIYVLGEQPNSEIVGNYFGKVGGFSQGASIYLDQGTRFLTITKNYSDNPNGWFFVWGKAAEVYNITASDNYSLVVHGNEGVNLNDSPMFQNPRSTQTRLDSEDKGRAGLQKQFAELRTKK